MKRQFAIAYGIAGISLSVAALTLYARHYSAPPPAPPVEVPNVAPPAPLPPVSAPPVTTESTVPETVVADQPRIELFLGVYPNPALTPGRVRPEATAAELCDKGFRTGRHRNVSGSMKEAVRRRYGIESKRSDWCNTERGCEIDHLVPLLLGGSNDIENLWPQPYEGEWNAHHKDQLEVRAKKLLCQGKITLEEAQNAFRGDWREGYRRFVAPEPKLRRIPRGNID